MTDWHDVKDLAIGLLLLIVVATLVLGPVIGTAIVRERQSCAALTYLDDDHDYHWTLWTGCMIQTPTGQWVHWQRSGYHDVDIVGR